MAKPSCLKAVIESLGVHLKAHMPSLNQVIYQFPDANIQLTYPSLSIIAAQPKFEATDPYVLSMSSVDVNHKALVKRVVGQYEFILQLDLWCRDKQERFAIFEEFFSGFNFEANPMGLSLKLANYHGVWCRYDMDGYDIDDSEASSQTAEWRVKLSLLANTPAVIEKSEVIVETIENTLSMPDTIEIE